MLKGKSPYNSPLYGQVQLMVGKASFQYMDTSTRAVKWKTSLHTYTCRNYGKRQDALQYNVHGEDTVKMQHPLSIYMYMYKPHNMSLRQIMLPYATRTHTRHSSQVIHKADY